MIALLKKKKQLKVITVIANPSIQGNLQGSAFVSVYGFIRPSCPFKAGDDIASKKGSSALPKQLSKLLGGVRKRPTELIVQYAKIPCFRGNRGFRYNFVRPDTLNLLGGGKPPALQYEFHTQSGY